MANRFLPAAPPVRAAGVGGWRRRRPRRRAAPAARSVNAGAVRGAGKAIPAGGRP